MSAAPSPDCGRASGEFSTWTTSGAAIGGGVGAGVAAGGADGAAVGDGVVLDSVVESPLPQAATTAVTRPATTTQKEGERPRMASPSVVSSLTRCVPQPQARRLCMPGVRAARLDTLRVHG